MEAIRLVFKVGRVAVPGVIRFLTRNEPSSVYLSIAERKPLVCMANTGAATMRLLQDLLRKRGLMRRTRMNTGFGERAGSRTQNLLIPNQ
jgi:hypothetical protein